MEVFGNDKEIGGGEHVAYSPPKASQKDSDGRVPHVRRLGSMAAFENA
jgi:hypothetical protein